MAAQNCQSSGLYHPFVDDSSCAQMIQNLVLFCRYEPYVSGTQSSQPFVVLPDCKCACADQSFQHLIDPDNRCTSSLCVGIQPPIIHPNRIPGGWFELYQSQKGAPDGAIRLRHCGLALAGRIASHGLVNAVQQPFADPIRQSLDPLSQPQLLLVFSQRPPSPFQVLLVQANLKSCA